MAGGCLALRAGGARRSFGSLKQSGRRLRATRRNASLPPATPDPSGTRPKPKRSAIHPKPQKCPARGFPHLILPIGNCEQLANTARKLEFTPKRDPPRTRDSSTRSKVLIRDKTSRKAVVHHSGRAKAPAKKTQLISLQCFVKLRKRFTRSPHKLFTGVQPNCLFDPHLFKQPVWLNSALPSPCE